MLLTKPISCRRAGLLQPHVEALRHRHGRKEGYCEPHLVWSGERDTHELFCSDYVFDRSGFPVADLSCHYTGCLVYTVHI
jgi:hypothetical protein